MIFLFTAKYYLDFKEVYLKAGYQWDYKVYFYGVKTYETGLNPYDAETAAALGGPKELAFRYSPLALIILQPVLLFSVEHGAKIFLILKAICFFAMLFILFKYIFRAYDDRAVLLVGFSFLFGYVLSIDLKAGNITVFEVFLITVGMLSLLKERSEFFYTAILLASIFKILHMALLIIPLTLNIDRMKEFKKMGMAVLILLIPNVFFALFHPELYSSFFNNSLMRNEPPSNFGSLVLINELIVPHLTGTVVWHRQVDLTIYFFWVAGNLLIAYLAVRHVEIRKNKFAMMCFFLVLYLVITPRLISYGFMLAVVPAVYAIQYFIKYGFVKLSVVLLWSDNYLQFLLPYQNNISLYLLYFFYVYTFIKHREILLNSIFHSELQTLPLRLSLSYRHASQRDK
jgi:hypothetical protein